jgi:hypothetical protein
MPCSHSQQSHLTSTKKICLLAIPPEKKNRKIEWKHNSKWKQWRSLSISPLNQPIWSLRTTSFLFPFIVSTNPFCASPICLKSSVRNQAPCLVLVKGRSSLNWGALLVAACQLVVRKWILEPTGRSFHFCSYSKFSKIGSTSIIHLMLLKSRDVNNCDSLSILLNSANHGLQTRPSWVGIGWWLADFDPSYMSKRFFHDFTDENSNSSKLVVEIDQPKGILDFYKWGR